MLERLQLTTDACGIGHPQVYLDMCTYHEHEIEWSQFSKHDTTEVPSPISLSPLQEHPEAVALFFWRMRMHRAIESKGHMLSQPRLPGKLREHAMLRGKCHPPWHAASVAAQPLSASPPGKCRQHHQWLSDNITGCCLFLNNGHLKLLAHIRRMARTYYDPFEF